MYQYCSYKFLHFNFRSYSVFRSSYGDGRWYQARVIRTSVNATLAVNLVGSKETPDGRFVDNGITAFESGHEITFGDLHPNRPNRFYFISLDCLLKMLIKGLTA